MVVETWSQLILHNLYLYAKFVVIIDLEGLVNSPTPGGAKTFSNYQVKALELLKSVAESK